MRHDPLLWLLVFVPAVFAAERLEPEASTLLFVLSVLAIVPLGGAPQSRPSPWPRRRVTRWAACSTPRWGTRPSWSSRSPPCGPDNTRWCKATIAGAIVTNTLFMLGVAFLVGGLPYHVQEYNRVSARMQASMLFLATVALLVPSTVSDADSVAGATVTGQISVGPSVLLIGAYGLGNSVPDLRPDALLAAAGRSVR